MSRASHQLLIAVEFAADMAKAKLPELVQEITKAKLIKAQEAGGVQKLPAKPVNQEITVHRRPAD